MAYIESAERLISVVETAVFARQADQIWSDTEREEFIGFIAANPKAGDVIPETGGVRKVRWGRRGAGKRGGVRVIYYYADIARPLYLLMVYAKPRQDNLSASEKRTVRSFVEGIKAG
jgi:hypothetical protein